MGRRVFVQVPSLPSGAPSVQTFLAVQRDENNQVQIMATGTSQLVFWVEVAGAITETAIPYDPTAHLWWALREAGGRIIFETSATGQPGSWQAQHSIPVPFDVSAAFIDYGTGFWDPADAPVGVAEFANLNHTPTTPPPTGEPTTPPAANDVDAVTNDFSSSAIPPTFASYGTFTVSGGRGQFEPLRSYSGAIDTIARSLVGRRMSIEVTATPTGASSAETFFLVRLRDADDTQLGWNRTNDGLEVYVRAGAVSTVERFSYDPAADRFWAIRESAGTVFLETSPTAAPGSWIVRHQLPAPFDLSGVSIEYGSGHYTSGETPVGVSEFDNLNRTP